MMSLVTQMVGVYGDSYFHWYIPKHNICNASLAQTLYNSSCYSEDTEIADSVLLTQGCVNANRADRHWLLGRASPYDNFFVGQNLNQLI